MATKNHARVDSKLYSETGSTFAKEFLGDEPGVDGGREPQAHRSLGSLRRCAATRDLTSIGANVNYSARVVVRFMEGDPTSTLEAWNLITVPFSDHDNTVPSIEVEVQNLDTVRRFKSDLCYRLFPQASMLMMDEDRWPETSLYRRRQSTAATGAGAGETESASSLELIQDFEALYSFGLGDGDELILLLHNTDQDRRLTLLLFDATISYPLSVDDPVAHWVESVRRQKEFEQIVA